MRKLYCLLLITCAISQVNYTSAKQLVLKSPDKSLSVNLDIEKGKNITYSINDNKGINIGNGVLSMSLSNGMTLGNVTSGYKVSQKSVNSVINCNFYSTTKIKDCYNELTLKFGHDNYDITFRLYDNGFAYRYITHLQDSIKVTDENVKITFPEGTKSYTAYSNSSAETLENQVANSFESPYTYKAIVEQKSDKLALTPMIIDTQNGYKAVVSDYDVESFPTMFLITSQETPSVKGYFAKYPKVEKHGGYNNLQLQVMERENFICKTVGNRNFPWRMVLISKNDADILNNNVPYCLASPSRVNDISWIKTGKVAWDWWNDWNLKGVDFKTGVNNDTYKYYIDFASRNGIEYVIMDEGWAVRGEADLMNVVPEIDLKEIISYAKTRNVGIILWAGYYAFARDMENVVKHFSEMGVKGFKIDFMDRNDQKVVDFTYKAAEVCAKYKMLVDFHGIFPPTGLTKTYPNVLNFEGVFGLEQLKWIGQDYDAVTFETTVPFGRMVAGPMDYTQGAMRNSTKSGYHPSNSNPMSQGTRCRQLAEYVIFFSPLNMLCDSPTNYEREQECVDFIAKIPVTWDETKVIDAKIGEYIIEARRKGNTWYIGGITNWDKRNVNIDLSFIGNGAHSITLYRDGVNSDKNAEDYKIEQLSTDMLNVTMYPGGGFAAIVK